STPGSGQSRRCREMRRLYCRFQTLEKWLALAPSDQERLDRNISRFQPRQACRHWIRRDRLILPGASIQQGYWQGFGLRIQLRWWSRCRSVLSRSWQSRRTRKKRLHRPNRRKSGLEWWWRRFETVECRLG